MSLSDQQRPVRVVDGAQPAQRVPYVYENDKNAPIPSDATINEKYAPAMWITDELEAYNYFLKMVEHTMRTRLTSNIMSEATQYVRQNLGYYAGYYTQEVRERVERLYDAPHPVLGPSSLNYMTSQILALDRAIGNAAKNAGTTAAQLAELMNTLQSISPAPEAEAKKGRRRVITEVREHTMTRTNPKRKGRL